MNAGLKLSAVLLFALLFQVYSAGIASAVEASVLGAYSLVEIDGQELPVKTWSSVEKDPDCVEEILSGTLLLASSGDWAVLFEVRKTCGESKESEKAGATTWDYLAGSFEITGDEIKLSFFDSVTSGKIPIQGGDLVLRQSGDRQSSGQPHEYVLRRR